MAEFCKKCLVRCMGIDPEKNPEWLVSNNGICEGCGYEYLKNNEDDKRKRKGKKIISLGGSW